MNRRGFLGMIAAAFLPKPNLPAATLAAPHPEEAFQSSYSNRVSPGSELNVENLTAALEEFERMRGMTCLYVPRHLAVHAESMFKGKIVPIDVHPTFLHCDPAEWYLTCPAPRQQPGAVAQSA
jgi:hypothetical protein